MQIYGIQENGYLVVVSDDNDWIKVFIDGTWYESKIRNNVARRWFWRGQYKSRNGRVYRRKYRLNMESDVMFDIAYYVRDFTDIEVITEKGAA